MTVRNVFLAVTAAVMPTVLTLAQPVHVVQPLPGYQCMMLAKQWDGQGPIPPPVPVFSGPEISAAKVGIAGGTVIVPSPLRPVNGRSEMIFPNGRKVWIDVSNIVPWHANADPHATCRPVLLSNGRYGTDSG